MDLSTIKPAYHKYFTFALKDYNRTADKMKHYNPRNRQYQSLLDGFISILDDIDIWTITRATNREIFFRYHIQESRIKTPRTLAKQCKTDVNALAFQYHIEQFKALGLTQSQAIQCSKKFYIENYSAINEKLAELLEETLQETPLAPIYFVD